MCAVYRTLAAEQTFGTTVHFAELMVTMIAIFFALTAEQAFGTVRASVINAHIIIA
jgi:hypothetical protein